MHTRSVLLLTSLLSAACASTPPVPPATYPPSDPNAPLVKTVPAAELPAMAGELDGAFLEPLCVDQQKNGFCHHSGIIERKLKFGGDADKSYDVTLDVWAIAEGIKYSGGQAHGAHFYVGGQGITPRYSPCALKVGDQSYFLNRKEDRANDNVYKFEYRTPAIRIPGQSQLILYCTDDQKKHTSLNHPPPLGQMTNGSHVIAEPPARLASKLGPQPYGNLFIYLEVAAATVAN